MTALETQHLKKSPDYYYAQAKSNQSSRQEGRREMAEKINQKNLASSESSKTATSSGPKPVKYTRELISKKKAEAQKSKDWSWFDKHRAAIDNALARGEII